MTGPRRPTALVLGATGMLGSMVADVLTREPHLQVRATVRAPKALESCKEIAPEVDWHLFDAEDASEHSAQALTAALDGVDLAVNAIGVIKPHIHDDDDVERYRAVTVNAIFPYRLSAAAAAAGARVIQIATDCVYSGTRGRYREEDAHDALDVYGKSKSLGEVPHLVHHLRCSIVGPEPKLHVSLLDWLLRQPASATVNGFTNHRWNGLTTLHFGRICAAVARGADLPQGVRHLVPADDVTKAELLTEIATAFGRGDISVRPMAADVSIDRTLATNAPDIGASLWEAAGYPTAPTVSQMMQELADFDYRLNGATSK